MPQLTFLVEQLLAPVPGGTGRVAGELAAAMAARVPTGWHLRTVSAWHRSVAAADLPGIGSPRRLPIGRRVLAELWARGLPPWFGGDVLLAPTPLFPPRRPPWQRRQRRIVIVHDAVPFTHPETLTPRGVAWHRRMIGRAAVDADAIVVPADAVGAELGRFIRLQQAPTVTRWGVGAGLSIPADGAARRAALGLPTDYAIFVSTIEPRKGLDVALAALGDPALSELPLAIVGAAGWGDGIDQLLADAKIEANRVFKLGRLSDADLVAAVAGAVALVAPSRSEGFGLPVLEAMAIGAPVIHSDVPALVELTNGAALVTPVGDHKALAAALAELLANSVRRAELIAAGRARAATFSWENAADTMWRLVTEIKEIR